MPHVSKNANFSEKGIKNARLATLVMAVVLGFFVGAIRSSPALTSSHPLRSSLCFSPSSVKGADCYFYSTVHSTCLYRIEQALAFAVLCSCAKLRPIFTEQSFLLT